MSQYTAQFVLPGLPGGPALPSASAPEARVGSHVRRDGDEPQSLSRLANIALRSSCALSALGVSLGLSAQVGATMP